MNVKETLKNRRRMRCQKCGGQLLRYYDDIGCLQCGAIHIADGRLETISSMMNLVMAEARTRTPGPGKSYVLSTAANGGKGL